MNKLITFIIIASFVLAASAFAKIGETAEQILRDAQRDKDTTFIRPHEWQGNRALEVRYRDGSIIRHVYGREGREIAFYLWSAKRLTDKDVVKIQHIFHTTWRGTGTQGGLFSWQSASGLFMSAQRMEAFDYLYIFDMSKGEEIPGYAEAKRQLAPNTPAPDFGFQPAAPTVAPKVAVPTLTPTDQNDCVLVATEALSRMAGTAYWARIGGFTWTKDGKAIGKHAVLFFQPTEYSNVMMYDKSGSLEIPTQSHEVNEITSSLNRLFSSADSPARAEFARWMDADGWNLFQELKQPMIATTEATAPAATTPEQLGEAIAMIAVGLLMLLGGISVIVICFLKGKIGFGVIGLLSLFTFGGTTILPLIGAIRIAKPDSWWARKKYGPKKMEIAHRRFTPQKVQETKPVIIDDPVERALERVKRNNPTVISQPNEIEPRPSHTKSLWKTIASGFGTVVFWLGFILANTYLFIVFIAFLVLWQREYCSLTISGLIAVGAWIVLRTGSGFVVLAGLTLKSLGSEEDDYV